MRDIEEIKTVLREIQGNFNPEKETYKLIDEVVNNSLSSEEAFKKLCEIKGVKKYPEALRNKYINIMKDLQEIVIEDRKKEEKKRQEENTKELRDIIASLEKTKNNKKRADMEAPLVNENVVFDDNSGALMDEEESESLDKEEIQLQEDRVEVVEDKNSDKTKSLSLTEDESKDKNLFNILLVMIFLTLVIGVLIFLFF